MRDHDIDNSMVRDEQEYAPTPTVHVCDICSDSIYEGEEFVYLPGEIVCEDCIDKHRRTA